MRVVIVSRGIPSDRYKLQGIFEYDQAKALAKYTDNEIFFVALDLRSVRRWRKWGTHEYYKDGVHVISVNVPLGRVPDRLLDRMAIRKLKKVISRISRSGKIDIIHGHFIENGYYSLEAAKSSEIPVVVTEHRSDMFTENLSQRFLDLGERTYNRADHVIAVSSALGKMIKKNFDVDVETIPDIVDLNDFKYNENAVRGRDIISVGVLSERKNFADLIRAFAIAFPTEQRKLIIVGSGEQKHALEELAEKAGIRNRVAFMGTLSRGEISEEMDKARFFALTTKSETFGVVFIEALAKGLPVLATRCGGPEDFVNSRNGVLVGKGSLEEVVRGLKYLDENIEKFDRREIADDVEKSFAGEVVAKQINQLYLTTVKKRSCNGKDK